MGASSDQNLNNPGQILTKSLFKFHLYLNYNVCPRSVGFLHNFGIITVHKILLYLFDAGHLRLTDFGLSRRLERGARAFTICGTIQYMAPEVLSGGPYRHADWWSLGMLLILSLSPTYFPVPPEPDHSNMLRKVRDCPYSMPKTFYPALTLLLTEVISYLCKNPAHRLRSLELFQRQTFFRGISFDSQLLQKRPVELILELKNHPNRPNFDCDILHSPTSSTDMSPTLANIDLS
uniref:Ribosomal protein S6 kinase related a n=1 Tax=Oncorhynchus mykiss TaxID=8022 RepID=A0A8C7TSF7_ONCMY